MKIKKLVSAGIVAGAVAISSIGAAGAIVSFGDGVGYIGRGDVIDHPTLGKAALVLDPVVSYASEGFYIQSCLKTIPNKPPMLNDFKKGSTSVTAVTVTEKVAKGSSNITGYRLSYDTSASGGAPTTACPGGWSPNVNGEYPTPVLVSEDIGSLIFTTSGGLSGSWTYDETANEGAGGWVAVQPVTP